MSDPAKSTTPAGLNSDSVIPISPELRAKILGATRNSRLGAILACALGEETPLPYFAGKACVTSDGFVMATFVDEYGGVHVGAFVGSVSSLDQNVTGLAKHLQLNSDDHNALTALVAGWIATDYRAGASIK